MLCRGIKVNRSLIDIDLSKNDLTSSSIGKLASALRHSPLQRLILRQNAIGNEGAKELSRFLGHP
jgi:Ran GTPase-activating protein (RanGAP) involved in mRNA processing and transport